MEEGCCFKTGFNNRKKKQDKKNQAEEIEINSLPSLNEEPRKCGAFITLS
jgi:hypothetical protein